MHKSGTRTGIYSILIPKLNSQISCLTGIAVSSATESEAENSECRVALNLIRELEISEQVNSGVLLEHYGQFRVHVINYL